MERIKAVFRLTSLRRRVVEWQWRRWGRRWYGAHAWSLKIKPDAAMALPLCTSLSFSVYYLAYYTWFALLAIRMFTWNSKVICYPVKLVFPSIALSSRRPMWKRHASRTFSRFPASKLLTSTPKLQSLNIDKKLFHISEFSHNTQFCIRHKWLSGLHKAVPVVPHA